jgi:hypothetical protein
LFGLFNRTTRPGDKGLKPAGSVGIDPDMTHQARCQRALFDGAYRG